MTVIAEGVESFEELAYLQAATKIRYAQGYYFARPIFLEELRPATPLASESRVSLREPARAGEPPGLFARRALSALTRAVNAAGPQGCAIGARCRSEAVAVAAPSHRLRSG